MTNTIADIWYGVFLRTGLAGQACFIMCIGFGLDILRAMIGDLGIKGRLMAAGILPCDRPLFFMMFLAEPDAAPKVFGRVANGNTPQFSEITAPKSDYIIHFINSHIKLIYSYNAKNKHPEIKPKKHPIVRK